ncbi:hypothetical protein KC331_g12600 [Hortaea werneckii]|nr:hypothetical protein KC331_g12600 [Hortaea werneckii]KAI7709641.1 hypothetical protein KC353_g10224 [Hortaea werneckii]
MANTNNANKSSPGSFVTPEPLAPLLHGLKRAFDSPKHADLTIICQGRQWKAHKVLLCAQSEWFEKSCTRCWKEGKEGTITLEEDDPQVVDAMLHWFYEFDYGTSQDNKCPLVLDLRVHAAAEKYLLPNLKRLAATKFEQRAQTEWKSEGFANAVYEAYVSLLESDSGLKQKIVQIVNEHRSDLFHPVQGSETFKNMAFEIPEFGRDVLIASSGTGDSNGWVKYKCPHCTAVMAYSPSHGGLVISRPRTYTFTAHTHAMARAGGGYQQISGEDAHVRLSDRDDSGGLSNRTDPKDIL